MSVLEALREARDVVTDVVTMPLTPSVPGRLPWMPVPKRNVCWLLAEMRSFYEREPWHWTQGQFSKFTFSGYSYCLVGLAYHLSGRDRRLARKAIDCIGETLQIPKPLREFRVAMWNDTRYRVNEIITVLAAAENQAERAGHCEP